MAPAQAGTVQNIFSEQGSPLIGDVSCSPQGMGTRNIEKHRSERHLHNPLTPLSWDEILVTSIWWAHIGGATVR